MVSLSVSWPVSMMIGDLKPFLRRMRTARAHRHRQADIHDHQVDVAVPGGLHALGPAVGGDGFEFLVQGQLLDQGSRSSASSSTINMVRLLGIVQKAPSRARKGAPNPQSRSV